MDLKELQEMLKSPMLNTEIRTLHETFRSRLRQVDFEKQWLFSTATALTPWVQPMIESMIEIERRIVQERVCGFHTRQEHASAMEFRYRFGATSKAGRKLTPFVNSPSLLHLLLTTGKVGTSRTTRGLMSKTPYSEGIRAMSVCETTLSEQQWDTLRYQQLSRLVGRVQAGKLVGLPSK